MPRSIPGAALVTAAVVAASSTLGVAPAPAAPATRLCAMTYVNPNLADLGILRSTSSVTVASAGSGIVSLTVTTPPPLLGFDQRVRVSWTNTAPDGGSGADHGTAASGWTRIGAFGGSNTVARIETGSGRVAFDVTVDTLGALVRYTSSGACRGELSVTG
ncbi:hypothetical protein GOPIP_011_00510 [Gordonia polyisoprenivorans NBRC 16320 = JCM 10675]|uniref:Secreted protein n=1 Tax=Gordonia polyisoprenivorans TaxID=84595 RepID=A0A846WR12_9ACTN|nr:hypothetical protein [Gordonia polyisoprenivorans]NKY03173.1 hypothetical protein [Gordonia polyisoprenivorans]GAB21660.1 hypothetical protein GOPIP_011_00510 [Gordonia polyisoprenivorans NBRC 16320 = JCM 10675]